MRPDMSHVIVERPRRGGGARKGRALELDDLPSHEGIGRPHISGPKYLNENLNPLERYLTKQVGRAWDSVYAEISAHLRADNTVQQHVRDHLRDFVAVRPFRPDGLQRYVRRCRPWYQPLYVDPDDGILKRTDDLPEVKAGQRALKHRPEPPRERIPIGKNIEIRRIAGLWYEIRLAELPPATYVAVEETPQLRPTPWKAKSRRVAVAVRHLTTPAVQDLITGQLIPVGPTLDTPREWGRYRASHRDRHYAIAKRRLSRAELRRHGVADQPAE